MTGAELALRALAAFQPSRDTPTSQRDRAEQERQQFTEDMQRLSRIIKRITRMKP